ncbi:MAG: hypothetical protein QGG73_06755, partial [Candidatus Hydrogenedentes bacterium]|nr:hypothetical protein [Candidatus Hydrogenedentota bacterium]
QDESATTSQKQLLLNRAAAQAGQLQDVLHYIGDRAMQHYSLSESAAEQLQNALRESVTTLGREDEAERIFWSERRHVPSTTLVRLLSYPACRSVLAEHLSAQQVQDFQGLVDARDKRDKEAIAEQLVSLADYQLGLTPGQRQNIKQTILAGAKPDRGYQRTSRDVLWTDERFSLRRLRGLSLDGMLSPAQTRIHSLLFPDQRERGLKVAAVNGVADVANNAGQDQREVQLKAATEQIIEMERAGKMSGEEAGQLIEETKRRIWREFDSSVAADRSRDKTEDRDRLIAEAKLAAHTEQLGELDARASKRLTLVAKGVVERYLENKAKPRQAYSTTNVAHVATTSTGGAASAPLNVTNYPLYQQTIKTVLSEEAYDRYQAAQAERISYRQNAVRKLLAATMDTRLLLNDEQRAETDTNLAAFPLPDTGLINAHHVLDRFLASHKFEKDDMPEWQRSRYNELLHELLPE